MSDTADVVVIGAGFAGASTAYHLVRSGARRVVLLEREVAPGRHASGRNAALADAVEDDPVQAALLEEGLLFIQNPPPGFCPHPLFTRTGSLWIGARGDLQKLRGESGARRPAQTRLEDLSIHEAARRVDLLAGARAEAALWSPDGGVADIHAFLTGYIKAFAAAGGTLHCESPVTEVRRRAGGPFLVATPRLKLEALAVVNAAGAWAGEVGRLAGALSVPLTPYRRHLFQSVPLADVDPRWPFVWDETRQYYFRPESGGLLLSPCDRTAHPPAPPVEDSGARELLAEKLMAAVPRLASLRLARGWACLRTFVPDSRFVIGEDPSLEGFFWAAGLGGTGMTASAAVGRRVAESVLAARSGARPSGPLSAARFEAGSGAGINRDAGTGGA